MADIALVRTFQAASDMLSAVSIQDVMDLWSTSAELLPAARVQFLEDALQAVLESHGPLAADIGAELYEDTRVAAGFGEREATRVDLSPDQLAANIRWAVQPILDADVDDFIAFDRATGVTDRLLRNVARDTITASTGIDPESRGVVRVARANACDFCLLLASRGVEHVDMQGSAQFNRWHTHCRCAPTPAYGKGYDSMPDPDALYRDYLEATRGITDHKGKRAAWRAHLAAQQAA